MKFIDRVLTRSEFKERPPVLVDIGASAQMYADWERIARHSICLAFDADDREFSHAESASTGFRKLLVQKSLVTDTDRSDVDFYLTRSPQCSSTLKPDQQKLGSYLFSSYFEVERTVRLRSISITNALRAHGLEYVDWFKTDSQGTDLRLFRSLGEKVLGHALVADFEPGLIDAYEGEDKFWHLLSFMEQHPFWICGAKIKGNQRIKADVSLRLKTREKSFIHLLLNPSPGWVEVSFMNTLERAEEFDCRDILLAGVLALVKGQYGFAAEVSQLGVRRYGDPMFMELQAIAFNRMKLNTVNLIRMATGRVFKKLGGTLTKMGDQALS